jgi:hypothetical protein
MGTKRTLLTPAAASFGALFGLCSTLAAITLPFRDSPMHLPDYEMQVTVETTYCPSATWATSIDADGVARCRYISGWSRYTTLIGWVWRGNSGEYIEEPVEGHDEMPRLTGEVIESSTVELPEVTASWKALKEDIERARREEQQKATDSELTPER